MAPIVSKLIQIPWWNNVVIELKTGDFESEHGGKLNFYLKAIDELLKRTGDQPTIGVLLCKHRGGVGDRAIHSVSNRC
ncbi:MAG: PDDEXK nuclease domain-containing protein [Cyanobacteria bacterium P01_F01_bin.150]